MNEEKSLTIREEEAVEALMLEQFQPCSLGVDPEIEDIIRHVYKQQQTNEQRYIKNRSGLNIQQEDFDIHNIVEQVLKLGREESVEQMKVVEKKESVLEEFDRQEMKKLRLEEREFLELEGKYPKVKECLGQKVRYPSIRSTLTKAERWFAFDGKDISDITDSKLFRKGEVEYRVYSLDEEAYSFNSLDNFTEPLVIKPGKGKMITCLAVSTCSKYLLMGLVNEIILYEVNSPKSISLVKNVTDLKVTEISHLGFCGNGFERLYVVDSRKDIVLVAIQSTFLFYRVQIERMEICLGQIMAIDSTPFHIHEDSYTLLAVCSRTQAVIYLLSPSRQLLHLQNFQDQLVVSRLKFNANGNTVDQHTVQCKWRYDPSSSMRPQLIISFWNRIIIVKMVQVDSDVVPFYARFDRFLHFTNHYPILAISLMTYNHLLIQSTHNLMVIAIPLITSSEAGGEFQDTCMIHVDSRECNKIFKTNSLCRKVMLVFRGKAELVEIIPLQEYIDKEIGLNSNHINIFSLLLLISKGINYSFDCHYSEDQLTKIMFYSVESLLVSLAKAGVDDNTLAIRLFWICELLVESSRQHLLWSLVYSLVKRTLKKEEVMFECLEGFFLKSMIGVVPEDIFLEIVRSYVKRGRSKVLLKAILTVDLQGHNIEKYLQLINQQQMYSLFIYLFQNLNEEADYLTPFIKIFSNFKAASTPDHKHYLGQLSLWYFYKCFKGYKFPDTPMNAKERHNCIKGLLVEPLNPTFSKHLMEFSEELFLTIYLYVSTNEEIMGIVKEENEYFVGKLKNFSEDAVVSQPFFPQMVMFLKKAHKKQTPLMYHFVAACALKIPIDAELLYETSLYYLTYPNLIAQSTLQLLNPLEKDSGKMLLNMLMTLKPLLKTNRLYLKKLLTHKSSHWQVVSYLHFLDGRYQTAVQSLLDSEKREDIFLLLREIIKQNIDNRLPDSQLQEIIQLEVGRLVRVNARETLKILRQMRINIDVILKQLRKIPQLKLQLMTSIILDNELVGKQQDITMLVEHLELVCEFQYKQVMKYLNLVKYPLDEAVKICERYGHFEGKAFMLQRSGDIIGALHSYQKAVVLKIKDKDLHPSLMKIELRKYFESSMEICKDNPCPATTPISENYWLMLMEIVKEIQDSNHSQKVDVMIELNQYFTQIHQHLFNYVPANNLLQYFFSNNKKGFLPRILLKSWHTLAGLLRFELSMFRQAIQANIIDATQILDIYSQQKWKGVYTQHTTCCFCDNSLSDQKELVVFSCRHAFHKVCHKSKICLACKFESDSLHIKSTLDRIISKRKQSEVWSVGKETVGRERETGEGVIVIELETDEERRKRLKPRLKSFDFEVLKAESALEETLQYYFERK